MKECLIALGVAGALAGIVFGIPAGLFAIHIHGANQGRDAERAKLVRRELGRYVFDADSGEAKFAYGREGWATIIED